MQIPNSKISKLDLSNQNLKFIPKEVFELKNLRKLNLSGNSIRTIPKEIEKLTLLENLDVSNNKIIDFYAKVCQLKALKKLNFNNNSIRVIPKQIKDLENLYMLSIANNKVERLPIEFSELKNLTKLNISKNPFELFPKEILAISNLKHLWLNNLMLKDLPISEILKKLTKLKATYFYGQIENRDFVDKNYKYLSSIKGNSLPNLIRINHKEEKATNLTNSPNKSKIFISYSHQDLDWLKKVQTNLKVLEFDQNKTFEIWDDQRIKSGDHWKKEIEEALKSCSIAILIVSTEFLASDFIQNNELPILLEKAQNQGTKIIPLIVGHCRFSKSKILSSFQAVNSPTSPLNSLTNTEVEKVLVKLTDDVESFL